MYKYNPKQTNTFLAFCLQIPARSTYACPQQTEWNDRGTICMKIHEDTFRSVTFAFVSNMGSGMAMPFNVFFTYRCTYTDSQITISVCPAGNEYSNSENSIGSKL